VQRLFLKAQEADTLKIDLASTKKTLQDTKKELVDAKTEVLDSKNDATKLLRELELLRSEFEAEKRQHARVREQLDTERLTVCG